MILKFTKFCLVGLLIQTCTSALAESDLHGEDAASDSDSIALDSDIHSGTLSLITENDVYAGTDRHYTNGFQMAYFNHPDELGAWVTTLADWLPLLEAQANVRTGYFFGHEIYTPYDTEATALLPNERPYAGWLYLGLSISSNTKRHFDVWRLNLGLVGEDARGEELQNGYHRLIDTEEANGWHNQIPNKFGYMLIYERGWSTNLVEQKAGEMLGVDLLPHLGFSLSNVTQYVNSGITFRFGNDLDNDFGPPRIRPSLPGSEFFEARDSFSWYFFAGIGIRYMDKNIFIDDHDTADLFAIKKERWLWDAQAGFVTTIGDVRLTYTFVRRSKEYDLQSEPDKFASLGLSIKL